MSSRNGEDIPSLGSNCPQYTHEEEVIPATSNLGETGAALTVGVESRNLTYSTAYSSMAPPPVPR